MESAGLSKNARLQGRLWDSGPWEQLAATLSDIHDELVARLAPVAGERWLDIGTGTGAVALRAARARAEVIGVDVAARLLRRARELATQQGTAAVRFDVGDCQALPYADGAFEVVSSAFGVSFAPDHRTAAAELARVCAPGGRLGLCDWLPGRYPEFEDILAEFRPAKATGTTTRHQWGEPSHVESLLGADFELEFFEGVSPWRGKSGAEIWDIYRRSNGQAREWIAALPSDAVRKLRGRWIQYFESFQTDRGIEAPRAYVITIGRRRALR
jgi:SAM-dependent methyltransferase